VPGVLADENAGPPPGEVEGADLVAALDEALLVEQPVGGEKVLAMDVADRCPPLGAERDVHRAVVQRALEQLVEADDDVERPPVASVASGRQVGGVQVAGERAGGDGEVAHAPFEEVAGERGLRELQHVRPRIERAQRAEDVAQAGEVRGVIALARPELGERDVEGGWHARKLGRGPCAGNRNHRSPASSLVTPATGIVGCPCDLRRIRDPRGGVFFYCSEAPAPRAPGPALRGGIRSCSVDRL
jgi:hypothetical protein